MPTTLSSKSTPTFDRTVTTTTLYSPFSQTTSVSSVKNFDSIEIDRKTWVRTPNYRVLVKEKRALPDNSFRRDSNVLYPGRMEVTTTTYGSAGNSVRRMVSTPHPLSFAEEFAFSLSREVVFSKLIEKAKGYEWNLPVFFAEAAKTADMVGRRAYQLAHMFGGLRRGDFSVFAGLASSHSGVSSGSARRFQRDYSRDPKKAAADAWLEYRYGWIPFASDVYNAMQVLFDVGDTDFAKTGTVRASSKQQYISTRTDVPLWYDSSSQNIMRGTVKSVINESERATWRFKIKPGDIPARLGLNNPATIVWELLPYSFVVDWFIPIGNYLSSLDLPTRFDHLGGTFGQSQQVSTTVSGSLTRGNTVMAGGGEGKRRYVMRSPMLSLPSIRLLDLSPRLNPFEGNVIRATSGIALLYQQFTRARR